MDAHIDWVSFTLPVGEGTEIVGFGDFQNIAWYALEKLGAQHYEYISAGIDFNMLAGRPPYRYQMERSDRGVRIYGGGANRELLFELTGRSCEGLRGEESYTAFLAPLVERVTRLDLAVDIRANTRPAEFSNDRNGERFKSVGFQRSSTGETCYIGSTKSDRFARVYRYNHPHPRSEYLRVEFVFRKKLAKSVAETLSSGIGLMDFVATLGNTFGFKHPTWQPGVENSEKMHVPVVQREMNDTVAWLYKSVAPSIRKMVESGALDWDDFSDYIWHGNNEPKD